MSHHSKSQCTASGLYTPDWSRVTCSRCLADKPAEPCKPDGALSLADRDALLAEAREVERICLEQLRTYAEMLRRATALQERLLAGPGNPPAAAPYNAVTNLQAYPKEDRLARIISGLGEDAKRSLRTTRGWEIGTEIRVISGSAMDDLCRHHLMDHRGKLTELGSGVAQRLQSEELAELFGPES
jgi:hypothetical protein